MTPPLQWGLSLSLAGELAEPRVVAEIAASAEASGWDGVFVWDHLWNRTGAPFADPWSTLAAIALATERVRLGPLVTPLPRRRPQVVAQQATTLDRLSRGRLTLGLGLGTDGYGEFSAFNEPADDDRRRAAALDRGIELLLPALAGGPVNEVDARWLTAPGLQRPRCPIWVAGRPGRIAGPKRALRHGLEGIALVGVETWSASDITETVAIVNDLRSTGPDSTGRDPTEPDPTGPDPTNPEIILVGGNHLDPEALAAAGAAWAVREVLPGASADEARGIAGSRPESAQPE